jgi:hypothetical protein
MRRLMIVTTLFIAATLSGGHARAATVPNGAVAMVVSEAVPLQKAQYVWGGRNYCWYGNGWQGPGWYWCGYRWRRGFGWGGGYGWNGWAWRGPGWRGGGWYGRRRFW